MVRYGKPQSYDDGRAEQAEFKSKSFAQFDGRDGGGTHHVGRTKAEQMCYSIESSGVGQICKGCLSPEFRRWMQEHENSSLYYWEVAGMSDCVYK